MAATVTVYTNFASGSDQIGWNGIAGDLDGWLVVIHAMAGGNIAKMGGDPSEFSPVWPPGAWQFLGQADAGDGLLHIRAWATKFHDLNVRDLTLPNDSGAGAESHSHLYFLSGTREGEDITDVFSVGAVASTTAGTAQAVPLYGVDGTELLIGAWLGNSLANYTALGGLTMRAELDAAFSTSRTGEQTLSATGPDSRSATFSSSAIWAALTIAVRQPSAGSVTFPQQPLRMKTELALGANPGQDPALWAGLWTDVTDDAQPRNGGVTIARGRADEASSVNPSSMAVTLDNSSGKYVRLNPLGPYYGQLSKNTPIQHWVDFGLGWLLRFRGFISEFPPRSQGGTIDEHMPIEASGVTRRLARGRVLNSPLRKAIPSRGNAIGYWPLESDGASGLANGLPMRIRGGATFGDGGPPGSAGALTAPFGSSTFSTIQGMPSTGSWQVSWWIEPSSDLSSVMCWVMPNSFYARWFAYVPTSGVNDVIVLEVYPADSNTGGFSANGTISIRNLGVALITVRAKTSGSDIAVSVFVNGVLDFTTTGTGASVLPLTTVGVNNLAFGSPLTLGGDISHVYVSTLSTGTSDTTFAASLDWLTAAGSGYAGERACDRIRRVSNEESVPVAIVGDDGRSEPMGPQPISNFLTVLTDVENTDGGMLFERRDARLAYQARAGRYNATPALTLDYASGHVAPPLEPTDDDQHIINDFTASRDGGLSARVFDQGHIDSVGEYASSESVNVDDDDQLADQAGWRVHLGTADDLRYPSLTPNLNGKPVLVPDWAALDVGQAVAMTTPGRDLPPGTIDAFAEGYTETIDTASWNATANCSPGKPWKVIVLDDSILGRVDTDGSALNSSATTTATSLSVKTLSGPLWTTDPADLPFDWVIGGEVVRVLDPANRITDTFTRSASSSWGTADTGQSWATSGGSAANYSVTGSTGRVSLTDVTTRRFTSIGSGLTDATAAITVSVPVTALTDTITAGIVMRYTDDNNLYLAQLTFATNGKITVELFKRVTGTFTSLGSAVDVLAYSPGVPVRMRAWCVGTMLQARVWQADQIEPGVWHASAVDATFSSGKIGTKTSLGAANTNTLPVAIDYDDFDILTPAVTGTSSPQTVKVVRSINGVVKTHAANEDVRLALPPILSL
jgi:hypothetical protein